MTRTIKIIQVLWLNQIIAAAMAALVTSESLSCFLSSRIIQYKHSFEVFTVASIGSLAQLLNAINSCQMLRDLSYKLLVILLKGDFYEVLA